MERSGKQGGQGQVALQQKQEQCSRQQVVYDACAAERGVGGGQKSCVCFQHADWKPEGCSGVLGFKADGDE